MSRKSPSKGTGPAPASLRAQDPHLARERAKYQDPLPSREFILSLVENAGIPVEVSELEQQLDIRADERDPFSRRLAAMERDGQLMRNRRNALCLPSKMDLIKARVEGHPDGFGFAVPEDRSPDLFLGPKEMHKALHGDTVLVRVGGTDRRGRREGFIAEVLERANTRLVARLHSEHGVLFAVAENRRISQDFLVAPGQDMGAQPGQVVMVELLTQPSRHAEPISRVVEIVGNYADSGMEVEIALRKHDLPHEFPPAAQQLAARLPTKVMRRDLAGRVDVRNLPLVTIDGETARDFDDAVYCAPEGRGFRLMVAIADVSHYVRPGDALDQEAYTRGNSVYFPRRVIPMLPEELSNGLCSLNPDVDRLCMMCEMTVSPAGEISRYRFYPAVMHSHGRFTYTEVASILAKPASAAPHRQALVPHLRMLDKVYRAFFKARSARGAIDFATVETQMMFDDQGKIDRVVPVERNDAHRIIEECMLAANVCASDYLAAHKHPTLYRIHPGPTPEKLEAVRQFLGEVGLHLGGGEEPRARDYAELIDKIQVRPDRDLLQTVLLRSLQQARYSPENVGHFGLAYEAYAHFTSPIRRYPDLLVHRAIRAVLAGEEYKPGPWADIGLHCSGTERRADEATRDVEQWLKCWFMRDRINQEFEGTVSAVVHFGLFVTLDDVHVEGLIHISELGQDYYHHDAARHQLLGERSGKRWRLGDRIRIRVVRVDLETTRIDFVPAPQAAGTVAVASSRAAAPAPGKSPQRGKGRSKAEVATVAATSAPEVASAAVAQLAAVPAATVAAAAAGGADAAVPRAKSGRRAKKAPEAPAENAASLAAAEHPASEPDTAPSQADAGEGKGKPRGRGRKRSASKVEAMQDGNAAEVGQGGAAANNQTAAKAGTGATGQGVRKAKAVASPKAVVPQAAAPKAGAPKVDAPKADASRAAAPKAAAPKAEVLKETSPRPATPKARAPRKPAQTSAEAPSSRPAASAAAATPEASSVPAAGQAGAAASGRAASRGRAGSKAQGPEQGQRKAKVQPDAAVTASTGQAAKQGRQPASKAPVAAKPSGRAGPGSKRQAEAKAGMRAGARPAKGARAEEGESKRGGSSRAGGSGNASSAPRPRMVPLVTPFTPIFGQAPAMPSAPAAPAAESKPAAPDQAAGRGRRAPRRKTPEGGDGQA